MVKIDSLYSGVVFVQTIVGAAAFFWGILNRNMLRLYTYSQHYRTAGSGDLWSDTG